MVTRGLREEAIALSRQALRCAPGEPDVSIFLIDGRVAAKKLGRLFPIDILSFALPLAPDPAHMTATRLRIGRRYKLSRLA